MTDLLWTMVVLLLCCLPCAWVGTWLVVQRKSMLGDGISHSILPGIVVAYLLTQSRATFPMLLGALVAGLLAVGLTQWLSSHRLIKEDAGLGAVFTTMFAIGVILLTRTASQVDLDPGCVLYGLAEFIPIDVITWMGMTVPRALPTSLFTLAVTAAVLWLLNTGLFWISFDRLHCLSTAPSRRWINGALMALVALVTVASFDMVGSILVVAVLVCPAAIAMNLSHSRRMIFWLSSLATALAVGLGVVAAYFWINTTLAGLIATFLGLFFAFSVVVGQRMRMPNPSSSPA